MAPVPVRQFTWSFPETNFGNRTSLMFVSAVTSRRLRRVFFKAGAHCSSKEPIKAAGGTTSAKESTS